MKLTLADLRVRTPKQADLTGMKAVERVLDAGAVDELKTAFSSNSETRAHDALRKYPIVFEPTLPRVGHHGMWFTNKPQIRPTLTNGKPGKIPDMLLAGRGSGGLEWFIVELKSPSAKLFGRNGSFSSVANSGLSQLAQYLIYANEKQGSIRDALEIKDFRNPKGILVIGQSEETENDSLSELKTFWNDSMKSIAIVSYSRLFVCAEEIAARKS